jgi:hypothetical protein
MADNGRSLQRCFGVADKAARAHSAADWRGDRFLLIWQHWDWWRSSIGVMPIRNRMLFDGCDLSSAAQEQYIN